MHWSTKVNPLNLLRSPSPSKSGLPHASGVNPPTRRQLELLSDDDDDQVPAVSSFKRPRISLPVMPNSSTSLLSEVSSILDSKGPNRRHPRKSSSPPVANSNTTTTTATVTPSKALMFQSNTPISKKERETTVRSILREPNTPGTGQSVRFFSKDAFRVISPNPSTCTSPETSPAFIDEINQLTNTEEHEDDRSDPHSSCSGYGLDTRPNLASKSTSILLPDSSHNGTNLFDMSLDMPAIPTPEDAGNMLSDDAMEVPEFDVAQPDAPSTRKTPVSLTPENSNGSLQLDSNGSFQATKPAARVPSTSTTTSSGSHNATMIPSPSTSEEIQQEPKRYWPTGGLLPTGLFGRRAPSSVAEAQADIIKTLRKELNLQKEISSRYQMDLDSRDALVEILSARVEYAETELEQWMKEEDGQYTLIQDLKKQLYSLERSCGQLRAATGINRDEELSERSISDEASQQALKTLRSRIKHLEEQNQLLQRESEQNIRALSHAKEEADLLKSHLDQDEYTQGSNVLRILEECSELREKVADLEAADESQRKEIGELQAENARLQQTLFDERMTHDAASEAWQAEKDELLSKLADAHAANVTNGTAEHGNSQLKMLQEELEAQWERTEKAEETIKSLHQENHTLKGTLRSLQEKFGDDDVNNILELEQVNQDLVNQLNDILASQQALEEERDQISAELQASRHHVEDLIQSHSDLQRKLEQIEQEHGFATEDIERLRQTLASRDQEADRLQADRQQDMAQVDALRAELLSAEKEYSRQLSDCKRRIEELQTQLRINAEQSTSILHETAEQTVYMAALEEKAKSRLEDNERLRRRVHDLEQESAAKEVKLLETQKESDRIKEDNINLNIALDAKQQELELMKRREGTRGTAGATPAPLRSKNQPRESSIFGVTPRPLSNYNKNFAETPATVTKQMHTNSTFTSSTVKIPRDLKFGPPIMAAGPRPSITSPSPTTFPGPMSANSIRTNAGSRRSQTTLATSTRTLSRMEDHSDQTDDDNDDEKENWLPSRPNRRSNTMVPS